MMDTVIGNEEEKQSVRFETIENQEEKGDIEDDIAVHNEKYGKKNEEEKQNVRFEKMEDKKEKGDIEEDNAIIHNEKSDKKLSYPSYLLKSIQTKAKAFYDSILYPKHFLIFNVICVVQTIPALYMYITFYDKGYYIVRSTGMAPVWGCTIGAIATAIVTSALVPIPENFITKEFCIAIIIWEFILSCSLFISAVCLAALQDMLVFFYTGWEDRLKENQKEFS
jgi:hypothetical protein